MLHPSVGKLFNKVVNIGVSKVQATVLNTLNQTAAGKCLIVPVVKSMQDGLQISQGVKSLVLNATSPTPNTTKEKNSLNAIKNVLNSGQDFHAQWVQASSLKCQKVDFNIAKTVVAPAIGITSTAAAVLSKAGSTVSDIFNGISKALGSLKLPGASDGGSPLDLPSAGGDGIDLPIDMPIVVQGAKPKEINTSGSIGSNATQY
jgi:hypothetical protein